MKSNTPLITEEQHKKNVKVIYDNLPKECHHVFNDVLLHHIEARIRALG
jgi:hypothetical protein